MVYTFPSHFLSPVPFLWSPQAKAPLLVASCWARPARGRILPALIQILCTNTRKSEGPAPYYYYRVVGQSFSHFVHAHNLAGRD